jgi:hypothetical protein
MMITAAVLLAIGFGAGYGVRELVSRRRWAAAEKRHLESLAERNSIMYRLDHSRSQRGAEGRPVLRQLRPK